MQKLRGGKANGGYHTEGRIPFALNAEPLTLRYCDNCIEDAQRPSLPQGLETSGKYTSLSKIAFTNSYVK